MSLSFIDTHRGSHLKLIIIIIMKIMKIFTTGNSNIGLDPTSNFKPGKN